MDGFQNSAKIPIEHSNSAEDYDNVMDLCAYGSILRSNVCFNRTSQFVCLEDEHWQSHI